MLKRILFFMAALVFISWSQANADYILGASHNPPVLLAVAAMLILPILMGIICSKLT